MTEKEGNGMTMIEAAWTAFYWIIAFGALFTVGCLGLVWIAWISYRADGGKLGFWKFLRGI